MRKKAYKEFRRDGMTMHHTGYGQDRRKDKLHYNGPQWLRRRDPQVDGG